jgi:hypothetical protein
MGATDVAAAATARNPLVDRILGGTAPDTLRLTAARGALPLPAADLAYVQVCLLQDSVPEVARAAAESLGKAAPETILEILRDSRCDTILIDHFARSGGLTGATLEAAISHPAIPDSTLEALAAGGNDETLTLIVTNEVRIIRNPSLLGVLRANQNLSGDNRRRLAELERDFVGKEALKVRQAPVPASPAAGAVDPALSTETAPEAPPQGEAAPPVMTPEEEQQYEEQLRRTPAFQRIMKLNVAEKVQLAMKGNAEERAILVRDTAKMVALQVLKSPKLSDTEIAGFAGQRNVCEDILRVIASHRDWTKTYGVAHALVRNPKTPPGLTLQFLPRLGTRDLRLVTADKNIPELVRRQARTLFLARTQPPKKLGKKAH